MPQARAERDEHRRLRAWLVGVSEQADVGRDQPVRVGRVWQADACGVLQRIEVTNQYSETACAHHAQRHLVDWGMRRVAHIVRGCFARSVGRASFLCSHKAQEAETKFTKKFSDPRVAMSRGGIGLSVNLRFAF
jgi:hypothetical protein